jgi:ABC-type dipeptide/oligopeptide/nickel transport system permease component
MAPRAGLEDSLLRSPRRSLPARSLDRASAMGVVSLSATHPSIENVIIVIGIIPGVSRLIRGTVLSEKNNQYVEAAQAVLA